MPKTTALHAVHRAAGARMVDVPDVGHLIPYEAPAELAAAVRDFVRDAVRDAVAALRPA